MDRGVIFDHFTTLLGGKKTNEAGFNASNAILGVGKPVLSPLTTMISQLSARITAGFTP